MQHAEAVEAVEAAEAAEAAEAVEAVDAGCAPAAPAPEEEEVILDDIWTMYFHDPYDANWMCQSYHRLCDMGTVQEFVALHERVKEHLHQGMLFLFRESVFPCWDDPANIKGGCLSIKVHKTELAEFWFQLCARLLGEELLQPDARDEHGWDAVTGISTSPKRMFCIVKVWVRTEELSSADMFNLPPLQGGEIIFKSNRDNIDANNARMIAQGGSSAGDEQPQQQP